MNEDDLAHAQRIWDKLSEAAGGIAQRLVQCCRENDGETAALIATQLKAQPDSNMLMLVLGQLTTRLVTTQAQATQAHGPLITPEQLGYTPENMEPAPWQRASFDQLTAAAKDNDYRLYARMAVDNQLKSLATDRANGDIPTWEAIFHGMLMVDQQTMVVLCTEMLYRLAGDTP